jgi:ADP-heptose:LPS heptosyltransferase
VIALLDRSKGFVGLDSFLQHAAHAIKKKGVVLFGSADPKMSGHKSMINIKTDACKTPWDCIPSKDINDIWSFREKTCAIGHICMESITVEIVFDAVKEMLTL